MTENVPPALKRFIWDIQSMVELDEGEREILFIGRDLMTRLIASDDWLPPAFSSVAADSARQYQLYADGMERFSPVCLILAPGQATGIDEQPFWRIFGVLRGAVLRRRFNLDANGRPFPLPGGDSRLEAGAVECGKAGGFSQLVNPDAEKPAVVVQVFGGDIGKTPRRVFSTDGGESIAATGYSNAADAPPYDIWGIQTRIED